MLCTLADDPALAPDAADAIRAADSEVYVSAASAWEIEIKRALGKLRAPDDLAGAAAATSLTPLPITFEHAITAGRLPPHHADPFDRVLVAQALSEQLTLVTSDRKLAPYEVPTLSAG